MFYSTNIYKKYYNECYYRYKVLMFLRLTPAQWRVQIFCDPQEKNQYVFQYWAYQRTQVFIETFYFHHVVYIKQYVSKNEKK